MASSASAPASREHIAREPLDTTADVETPEHVRFRYRVAGPAKRSAAYAIDTIVRATIAVPVLLVAGVAGAFDGGLGEASAGVVLVFLFVLDWGYFVLLETLMGGKTFGKRAMGLRVVKQGGFPLRFGDSLLRNLLRAADFLPGFYAVGMTVMGADPYFRRLGDLVAGTLVVSESPTRVGEPLQISPPPKPQELARIPARPPLSPGEIESLELFLRRVGSLSPAREEELADMVAPLLARRMRLRYRNSVRFLALLYHRATGKTG